MRTRMIGSLEVSAIGLGCNNFGMRIDRDASKLVVDAALDAGVTLFDTADVYGHDFGDSEEFLGAALAGRRDDAVIATKFGSARPPMTAGASAAYVRSAVEASLRRLGTDRIDLYQLHKPDPEVQIGETLGALAELVHAGKVREIGCSQFTGEMLREADAVGREVGVRFGCVQNQLSLLRTEDEDDGLAACEPLGLSYLPFFPLASGVLTGKYRRGEAPPEGSRIAVLPRLGSALNERNYDVVERLEAWSADHGHTLLDLAHAWLLAKPAVASVISGATTAEQVEANAATGDWELSAAEVAEVDAIIASP